MTTYPIDYPPTLMGRLFRPRLVDDAPTRSPLAYSPFELGMLALCAQIVAYYARTGHWPRLAAHDAPDGWEAWR